jgi:prevent-host-death family protein
LNWYLDAAPFFVYTKSMPDTYNMKEAQANLTKLCRSGKRFVIANRNQPVVVAMPVEDFEALMETMDILADPAAMTAIRSAKAGKTQYRPLNLNDENFGL